MTLGIKEDILAAMQPQEDPEKVLQEARKQFTQRQLAKALGRSVRTLRRWEQGQTPIEPLIVPTLLNLMKVNTEKPDVLSAKFTFIDLFAGIGGMRKGFEAKDGRCVFTSEWDDYATKTYLANHVTDHPVEGDITKIETASIPDHDILLAGFPCQPFSIAGVSKKASLGRPHGFADETQGTLFFEIVKILREKQPKAFLLENVKNLRSHDKGNTFRVIQAALRELEYTIFTTVIDARSWVPQHRERVFIVGFKEPILFFDWAGIKKPNVSPTLGNIFHSPQEDPEAPYTILQNGKTIVNPKYTLTDKLWAYLQAYAAKHKAAGNGFGYSLFGPNDTSRTLSARYYKDGSEILIAQDGKNPRRLTPRECARLMGFDTQNSDKTWNRINIPVSDMRAYKQFGNSVAVPVVEAVASLILETLGSNATRADNLQAKAVFELAA